VIGAHRGFVARTTPRSPANDAQPVPSLYVIVNPIWHLMHAFVPPNYYVKGDSHIMAVSHDVDSVQDSPARFRDIPMTYVTWNLVGKFLLMWNWDDNYNGDVNIYPMRRKGFEVNALLGDIHGIAYVVHWPLFILSLAAPFVALVQLKRKDLTPEAGLMAILIPAFLYFLAGLWATGFCLPRYTSPLRPLSYILAAFSLSGLWSMASVAQWQGAPAAAAAGRSPASRAVPRNVRRSGRRRR